MPNAHPNHDDKPRDMTRDEALLRLGERLGDDAFASVHLSEVAITNPEVAAGLRAGRPARVHREWSVVISAPGYLHSHPGERLGAVVERALTDFFASRAARVPDKPPKLAAPGTAEVRQDDRAKDAG